MKRINPILRVLLVVMIVIVLLTTALFGWLYYSYSHHWVNPCDYKNSRWVSDVPNIELVVDEKGVCTAVFTIDTETVYAEVVSEGGKVYWNITDRYTETVLTGTYKCTEDQYVINVKSASSRYKSGADVFNGEYMELVFHKVS